MSCDKYTNKIIDEINEISDGLFDNITNLDQYALSTSKQVLKILIQYACLGQNCGPIELGRKKSVRSLIVSGLFNILWRWLMKA